MAPRGSAATTGDYGDQQRRAATRARCATPGTNTDAMTSRWLPRATSRLCEAGCQFLDLDSAG